MKKMMMVLMVIVSMSVASFAETVILMDNGTEIAFADTTSKQSQKLI